MGLNPILYLFKHICPVGDGFFLAVLDKDSMKGVPHSRNHVIGQIGFSLPDKFEHDVIRLQNRGAAVCGPVDQEDRDIQLD